MVVIPRNILASLFILMAASISGCHTPPKNSPVRPATAETLPAHDFRQLRVRLKGRPANEVVALLGQPTHIFSSSGTEAWDYPNVTYDFKTDRRVRNLTIWIRKGVVDYMTASY